MFLYYIEEIKNRSYFIFITWVSTIIISYTYKEKLLFLCLKPALQYFKTVSFYFIFTDITEIFSTYIELSYFVTSQMILIKILYHILIFISPGLYEFEYKKLVNIIVLSFSFFIFFFYLLNNLLLPLCWNFFLSFQDSNSYSINFFFEAKVNEFLTFYLQFYKFCVMCNCLFVSIFIGLDFLKLKNRSFFLKVRKKCYFGFLLLATFLTPPDIISQIIFVTIFIMLFEVLIIFKFFSKIINKVTN